MTASDRLFWVAAARLFKLVGGGFNGLGNEIDKWLDREKESVQPVKKSA